MNLAYFSFSWVDFAILLVILVGVLRGRRRGMSEELLDVIQWIAIVVVAALVYEPAGNFLSYKLPFSTLFCYVTVYLSVLVLFKAAFAFLRRQLGDKVVGSDVFGRAEYYLGMAAGGVRYACIVVVALAILNARYYTPEEIRADDAFQERNYGSIRFPTLYATQRQVFEVGLTGRLSRDHAPFLLIRPTAPEEKGLSASGIARARQSDFNDALGRR